MKKLIAVLFGCLFAGLVYSETIVEIVWPFSIAHPHANYLRLIIEQANTTQKEYRFVLTQRTGAGGYIAANEVKNSARPSLLASSPAFFVRPYLYPDQTYSFEDFRPVLLLGSGPVGFLGRADTTWAKIFSKKTILVGTNGVGSMGHIASEILKQKYPNVILVPYRGPAEALKAVEAGEVDLEFDIPNAAPPGQNLVRLFNVVGTDSYNGSFSLVSETDPVFAKMSFDILIVASSTMDSTLVKKLTNILYNANINNKKLHEIYQIDYFKIYQSTDTKWYLEKIQKWKELTKGIVAE